MKTFLILSVLAIVETTATTAVRVLVPQLQPQNPSQQQPQEQVPLVQQQKFLGQQQQFPPQQPDPQPQPFASQQPYLQLQPFPQPQLPYSQPQPFRPQQPYLQPQPQYSQPQQPISQQQQQQQKILQQILQQQLIPCMDVVLQQHNIAHGRSQVLQQSTYQLLQELCCQHLWQIPEQSQCQAIHNVVHAVILHQQQKQQQQQPSSQVSFQQPQQQYPSGQGFFRPSQQNPQAQGSVQPQQLPQFEEIRNLALQTLPAMCNVYIPPYCTITPFGIFGTN
uniref:Prolamin n=1 Tax=Triticum turgidum subsp. durum TaxID=4567 RepID=D2X6D2_TRITD|nr:alpha-gliadin [Triticum turgidum subsp. durum]